MAHIRLTTLQMGKDQGVLAVPHSRAYFLASQIQQLRGWELSDPSNSVRNMLILEGSDYSAFAHLEKGFSHLSSELPTVRKVVVVEIY